LRLLRRYSRIGYDAFCHFIAADGWAIASHIALSTLMALFPFLIVVTALAGFFGSKELADQAAHILLDAWPVDVSAPIAYEIHNVLTVTRGDVLTVGVALAIYFASSGIESLRIGLNRAYRISEIRSWWLLRLESIAYVIISAVALLALAFLVVLAPLILAKAAKYMPWVDPFSWGSTIIRYGMASGVLIVTLVIVHLWLPAGKRSLPDIAPGIIATLLLWLASGALFGRYLADFAVSYVSMYAGLASAMVALVYLYVNASIFIYGGELNDAICRARKRRSQREADGSVVYTPGKGFSEDRPGR
jgi:membrane protein